MSKKNRKPEEAEGALVSLVLVTARGAKGGYKCALVEGTTVANMTDKAATGGHRRSRHQ